MLLNGNKITINELVHADVSLVFCLVVCRSLFVFAFFLGIALSVLFRFTTSDYLFGIFKLLRYWNTGLLCIK